MLWCKLSFRVSLKSHMKVIKKKKQTYLRSTASSNLLWRFLERKLLNKNWPVYDRLKWCQKYRNQWTSLWILFPCGYAAFRGQTKPGLITLDVDNSFIWCEYWLYSRCVLWRFVIISSPMCSVSWKNVVRRWTWIAKLRQNMCATQLGLGLREGNDMAPVTLLMKRCYKTELEKS